MTSSSRHEVGNAHSQLLLDYPVSDAQLFLQVSDVVVSLSNVKVCSVFLPLEVNLFEVKQVLVINNIQGFDFILNHLLLISLLQLHSLVLQIH